MQGNVIGDINGKTYSIPTEYDNLSGKENIFHTLIAATHGFSNHKTTDDEKISFASTVLNRFDTGGTEFGIDGNSPQSISDVIFSNKSRYYEVNGKNERYNNAASDNVQKYNKKDFNRTVQLVGGVLRGTIPRKKGLFILKPSEMKKMKKDKSFDFKQTEELYETGEYKVLDYKTKYK